MRFRQSFSRTDRPLLRFAARQPLVLREHRNCEARREQRHHRADARRLRDWASRRAASAGRRRPSRLRPRRRAPQSSRGAARPRRRRTSRARWSSADAQACRTRRSRPRRYAARRGRCRRRARHESSIAVASPQSRVQGRWSMAQSWRTADRTAPCLESSIAPSPDRPCLALIVACVAASTSRADDRSRADRVAGEARQRTAHRAAARGRCAGEPAALAARRSAAPRSRARSEDRTAQDRSKQTRRRSASSSATPAIRSRRSRKKPRRRGRSSKRAWSSCTSWAAPATCGCSSMSSDLKEVGRAYRMVAAVAAIDRHRAEQHQQNLVRLRAAHGSLEEAPRGDGQAAAGRDRRADRRRSRGALARAAHRRDRSPPRSDGRARQRAAERADQAAADARGA